MQDPSSYPGSEMATVPAEMAPPLGAYKFSAEEQRVLQECNKESFFQRCIPIASLLGLGTYGATQTGHLRPNARFGAAPKVTMAVILGYFIGKLSYQEKCAEKLMDLPGSYIGQLLRERKEGRGRGSIPSKTTSTMFGAGPSDIYSDAGPGSALDLDTDRPSFDSDAYRPDNSAAYKPPDQLPQKPALSYDELRRRNRSEYSDTKQDPYRVDANLVPPLSRARPAPSPPPSTNKYGDVVE